MKANYSPFKKDDYVETDHGIINTKEGRYFTHRRPEHFFRKFQGFGISLTEVEMAKDNYCTNIVIKYHGKKKNTLFKIKLEYLKYLKRYEHEGDEQIILPLKEMEVIGEEVLE